MIFRRRHQRAIKIQSKAFNEWAITVRNSRGQKLATFCASASIKAAWDAIHNLYSDTSVCREQTQVELELLLQEIIELIESL